MRNGAKSDQLLAPAMSTRFSATTTAPGATVPHTSRGAQRETVVAESPLGRAAPRAGIRSRLACVPDGIGGTQRASKDPPANARGQQNVANAQDIRSRQPARQWKDVAQPWQT